MANETATTGSTALPASRVPSSLLLIAIFTLTTFLSALLLFSIQPLFAKMVLPILGGAPSVWAVALCFFQGALLAGYRYGGIKKTPNTSALTEVVLVVGDARRRGVTSGAERGRVVAEAAYLARDLANTPPAHLNARDIAQVEGDKRFNLYPSIW